MAWQEIEWVLPILLVLLVEVVPLLIDLAREERRNHPRMFSSLRKVHRSFGRQRASPQDDKDLTES